MAEHRIFTTSFASVYPHYLKKAETKGRTKEELDEIIRWLTGYSKADLTKQSRREPASANSLKMPHNITAMLL
ncbi:MAG TPA: DUF2200 family protein [Pyrinomonadaceae bacterium]|jgi:hypothetical protein|nr:DUF2200 family protein [Pyrinomonadaceae bacterium]